MAVGEFRDEETLELLRQGGFAPPLFRDAQRRLLRVPQNLSLFLDAGFATDRAPDFNTVTQLFDRYWDVKRSLVVKRAGHSGDHWEETLRLLCSEMTAKQELSARREVLDGIPLPYLEQMASEGILAFESKRYGFGHESFFDYCYARVLFLPRAGVSHVDASSLGATSVPTGSGQAGVGLRSGCGLREVRERGAIPAV